MIGRALAPLKRRLAHAGLPPLSSGSSQSLQLFLLAATGQLPPCDRARQNPRDPTPAEMAVCTKLPATVAHFTLPETPTVARHCNRSLCRRIGGPWVHFEFGTSIMDRHPEATGKYTWGDTALRRIRYKTFGCVTHGNVDDVGASPLCRLLTRSVQR